MALSDCKIAIGLASTTVWCSHAQSVSKTASWSAHLPAKPGPMQLKNWIVTHFTCSSSWHISRVYQHIWPATAHLPMLRRAVPALPFFLQAHTTHYLTATSAATVHARLAIQVSLLPQLVAALQMTATSVLLATVKQTAVPSVVVEPALLPPLAPLAAPKMTAHVSPALQ